MIFYQEADVSAEYMYMNQLARMLQDIKVSEGFNQEFKGKNKDIAGEVQYTSFLKWQYFKP